MTLKNKIVFITGASSGIGAACAYHFAKAGAQLILCARNLQQLQQVSHAIQQEFQTAILHLELDVRDRALVKKTLTTLPDEFKSIDILINNAGLAAGLDAIQDANIDDWEAMIDTNVKGLLYVTRAILPQMVARNSGHVINIGSISGHQVYPKGAVYCATKHAVKALTQGLRMDLFGTNIRVTSIDPGAVETNFSRVRFKGDEAKATAVYEGMTPLTADDIAESILFCATRPPHVNISEMIILPTDQASALMVARKNKHE